MHNMPFQTVMWQKIGLSILRLFLTSVAAFVWGLVSLHEIKIENKLFYSTFFALVVGLFYLLLRLKNTTDWKEPFTLQEKQILYYKKFFIFIAISLFILIFLAIVKTPKLWHTKTFLWLLPAFAYNSNPRYRILSLRQTWLKPYLIAYTWVVLIYIYPLNIGIIHSFVSVQLFECLVLVFCLSILQDCYDHTTDVSKGVANPCCLFKSSSPSILFFVPATLHILINHASEQSIIFAVVWVLLGIWATKQTNEIATVFPDCLMIGYGCYHFLS